MLSTISWMVNRDADQSESAHFSIVGMFLLGGLFGGGAAGALLALAARGVFFILGSAPPLFALASVVLGLVFLGDSLDLFTLPRPQFHHQVPEAWRNIFAPPVASFVYASSLGAFFFTRINSLVVYPLVALLLGMGKWPVAIVCCMAVGGMTRAATALVLPLKGLYGLDGTGLLGHVEARLSRIRSIEVVVLGSLGPLWLAIILGQRVVRL